MKNLLSLILLLSLSLSFYSCGGDDDKYEPEKFVWGGDWNNVDDPNYKPEYGGKYNPIKGLWRRDADTRFGLYFSKDLEGCIVYFYPNGEYELEKESLRKYEINDKAYRYSRAAPDVNRYKISGNKLYIYSNLDNDDKYGTYSKVIEK